MVRAAKGGDIRTTGSGGTGATNVSRSAGKIAGVLTLLLDALKGAVAILIAARIMGSDPDAAWWIAGAGLAVMLGHIFPVWLGFRGGKGVATGVGVFLTLMPEVVGLALLLFLIVVLLTRYVSLGSIVAALAIPVFVLLEHLILKPLTGFPAIITIAVAGSLLIVFAHRENIARLRSGTEHRFR